MELVLDKLANRADATVSKVVDVIGLVARFTIMQIDDVAHRGDDVVDGERRRIALDTELLVDLVAADLGKIVALRIEEEAVEQAACRINRRRLARAQTTIQFDESLFAIA